MVASFFLLFFFELISYCELEKVKKSPIRRFFDRIKQSFMKKPSKTFIYTSIIAILILSTVLLFWKNSLLLALLLAVLSILMIGIGKIKKDFYLYIIVFFIGSLTEAIGIAFGVWAYNQPDIIGIPYWLPFVWGNAGIFIKRLYSEINA